MNRLRKHLTFANVIACTALFVALGGVGYAATELPADSVGTRQLQKGAVTPGKLSEEARAALRGPEGPAGLAGQRGERGERGERGPAGPAGANGTSGGAEPVDLTEQVRALEAENKALSKKVDALEKTFAGVTRDGSTVRFAGVNVRIDRGAHDDKSGLGNLFIGREDQGSEPQPRTGTENLVIGEESTFLGKGNLILGFGNHVESDYSLVAGERNLIRGRYGVVTGEWNRSLETRGTVIGGKSNVASGSESTVIGGHSNEAGGFGSVVVGGLDNKATKRSALAAGGRRNVAEGLYSFARGGIGTHVSGLDEVLP